MTEQKGKNKGSPVSKDSSQGFIVTRIEIDNYENYPKEFTSSQMVFVQNNIVKDIESRIIEYIEKDRSMVKPYKHWGGTVEHWDNECYPKWRIDSVEINSGE
jgi:hypothetical protein